MSPSMDRAERIAELWNWLPAFRVVAEYGSIQRAALVLHVSPSSLSRTIRLLEENIGVALFLRSATGLTVTAQGVELLKGTREAMRRVDDVLDMTRARGSSQRLRVAAEGSVLLRLAARAAATVLTADAEIRLILVQSDAIEGELLRGNVDVALALGRSVSTHPIATELVSTAVGEVSFTLHEPPPLRGDSVRSVVLLDEHAGDAAEADLGGLRVAAVCSSIDAAEALAHDASLLALLPRSLAAPPFRVHEGARVLFQHSVVAVARRPIGRTETEPTDTSTSFMTALRGVLAG